MRAGVLPRRVRRGLLLALLLLAQGCRSGDRPLDEVDLENLPAAGGERVRVEVLNAGGRAGMARLATERLRDRRFDVVYFGNAGSPVESSEVLVRTGGMEPARRIAGVLGIDEGRVRSEPDTTLYVDVTVRLGPEWGPEADPAPAADSTGSP